MTEGREAAISPPEGPHGEYTRRRSACQEQVELLTRRDQWIGRSRLAAFALILGTCWLCFGPLRLSPFWLAVPGALFPLAGRLSRPHAPCRDDAGRGAAFYDRGIARLEDRWAGLVAAGERFSDPEHPYSSDLDLLGPASLFELLSLARTRQGEDTLARWLQAGLVAPGDRAEAAGGSRNERDARFAREALTGCRQHPRRRRFRWPGRLGKGARVPGSALAALARSAPGPGHGPDARHVAGRHAPLVARCPIPRSGSGLRFQSKARSPAGHQTGGKKNRGTEAACRLTLSFRTDAAR